MSRNAYTPEQIVKKLREADVHGLQKKGGGVMRLSVAEVTSLDHGE